MPTHELQFEIDGSLPRRELRKKTVEQFLLEEPGTGTGHRTSRYVYYVETLQDGRRVFLTRPARLKKGFDFLIHVERINFEKHGGRRRDYPKHDDIFEDLKAKKKENPDMYVKLHEAMTMVYDCNDPTEVLRKYGDLPFKSGYNIELILKVLKWFFIEQDIRDWNYSGRIMFKNGLDEIAYNDP